MSRLINLGCVATALFVALTMAGQAEDSGRLTGDSRTIAFALACVAALVLFARHRYPVGVAVLVAILLAATDLALVPALIAIFTVAANRRWSVTVAVVGMDLLLYVPFSVARPGPDLNAFDLNLLYVGLIGVAVALGVNESNRRDSAAALRERAARAGAQAELRADRLRAEERARMAREMHDLLAHRMSLVSLYAGALEIRTDLAPAEVVAAATTIRTHAHAALEDLREILGVLRTAPRPDPRPDPRSDPRSDPTSGAAIDSATGSATEQTTEPTTEPLGLLGTQTDLAGLDTLVTDSRSAGTPVEVDDRLGGAVPPASASRTAYRVVREGLTNARKHAPGAPVQLLLDRTAAGELHVRLTNPIPRPGNQAAIPGAHAGLVGLCERVTLAGGRVDHGARRVAAAPVTFHLEAWLPWPT